MLKSINIKIGNKGMSLIEVVVALALLSLISLMVCTTLTTASRTNAVNAGLSNGQNTAYSQAEKELSNGSNGLTANANQTLEMEPLSGFTGFDTEIECEAKEYVGDNEVNYSVFRPVAETDTPSAEGE